MAKKQCKPEGIVGKLSKTKILNGQGTLIAEAIGQLAVSELTFYQGGQRQADHATLAESLGLSELL